MPTAGEERRIFVRRSILFHANLLYKAQGWPLGARAGAGALAVRVELVHCLAAAALGASDQAKPYPLRAFPSLYDSGVSAAKANWFFCF